MFHYPPSKVSAGDVLAAIAAAGLTIGEVTTRETALEDIFLQLTNSPDIGDEPAPHVPAVDQTLEPPGL